MNSQVNSQKRFCIRTLGCKVNQYESQAMREILLKAGLKECLPKEMADIYIINTCTVTHHADKESRYLVGSSHRSNPAARIVVAGCYVEKNADEISSLPGVTHIVKNNEKADIAHILDGIQNRDEGWQTDSRDLSITGFKGRTKAFVKIQDGCENSCSYCKVPLVRGVLKSRPLDKIIAEIKVLLSNNFKELILTGICLGAWGKDISTSGNLVDLLVAIEKIDGNFRIRLSSIEPKYVTDEFIKFISSSKRICRHLHIPLQSGDDRILKRMNRPYTTAEYRTLIEKLKRAMSDIAISTDVMVGFPGESDANFMNTLNFIKSIAPSRTHIFTYSKRDGTTAFEMSEEVDEATAKKRYHDLKATSLMSSYLYRAAFMNKKLEVLVEKKRDRRTGLLTGYSGNYIKVLFSGPDEAKDMIAPVKIEDISLTCTMGIYEPK